MNSFAVSAVLGVALGFLFGVGCAAAVLYTIFLAGYRRALRDTLAGGVSPRYRDELRKAQANALTQD